MIDLALVLFGMSAFFCSLGVGGIGAAAVLDAWYRIRSSGTEASSGLPSSSGPYIRRRTLDVGPEFEPEGRNLYGAFPDLVDCGSIPVLVMDDVDTVPIVVDPRRSA